MTAADYISDRLETLEGWCSKEKATKLSQLVAEFKPKSYVEIGVFAGRSLFAVALAMRDVGTGHAIGIDPWSPGASVAGFSDANAEWWGKLDHDNILGLCESAIVEFKLAQWVTLVRKTAADAIAFTKLIGSIGMLHIDGNHGEESASFDVTHYVPLVSSGGIIVFDDTDWSTTQKALETLYSACKKLDQVGTCAVFQKPP